eukprot:jgi/Mesvir1/2666/Mv16268-RA.4
MSNMVTMDVCRGGSISPHAGSLGLLGARRSWSSFTWGSKEHARNKLSSSQNRSHSYHGESIADKRGWRGRLSPRSSIVASSPIAGLRSPVFPLLPQTFPLANECVYACASPISPSLLLRISTFGKQLRRRSHSQVSFDTAEYADRLDPFESWDPAPPSAKAPKANFISRMVARRREPKGMGYRALGGSGLPVGTRKDPGWRVASLPRKPRAKFFVVQRRESAPELDLDGASPSSARKGADSILVTAKALVGKLHSKTAAARGGFGWLARGSGKHVGGNSNKSPHKWDVFKNLPGELRRSREGGKPGLESLLPDRAASSGLVPGVEGRVWDRCGPGTGHLSVAALAEEELAPLGKGHQVDQSITIDDKNSVFTSYSQDKRGDQSIRVVTSHVLDARHQLSTAYVNGFDGSEAFSLDTLHGLGAGTRLNTSVHLDTLGDCTLQVGVDREKSQHMKTTKSLTHNVATGDSRLKVRVDRYLMEDVRLSNMFQSNLKDHHVVKVEATHPLVEATTLSNSFLTDTHGHKELCVTSSRQINATDAVTASFSTDFDLKNSVSYVPWCFPYVWPYCWSVIALPPHSFL